MAAQQFAVGGSGVSQMDLDEDPLATVRDAANRIYKDFYGDTDALEAKAFRVFVYGAALPRGATPSEKNLKKSLLACGLATCDYKAIDEVKKLIDEGDASYVLGATWSARVKTACSGGDNADAVERAILRASRGVVAKLLAEEMRGDGFQQRAETLRMQGDVASQQLDTALKVGAREIVSAGGDVGRLQARMLCTVS